MEEVKINDMLWQMQGTRQNDTIHWKATPKVVEVADEHKFLLYSGGGGSWGLVGKMWFRTKEECEQNFLKNHESFDEPIDFKDPTPEGIEELPRTDWENYEVNRFDGIDDTAVYLGGLSNLQKITQNVKWHKDTEHEGEYGMVVEYSTLHEISEQFKESMITVIVNGPMRTKVFQYGNYPGAGWIYLGNIQGYA